jgi:hypothetical protein
VVALLSVFALPGIVETIIDINAPDKNSKQILQKYTSGEALRESLLLGLAKEMGQELPAIRGDVLRRSVKLEPSPSYIKDPEFIEPHRRGEIFVAALMNSFVEVWSKRLGTLGTVAPGRLDRARVVEEGAMIADYLLTMVIRALDYAPPVNLEFCDFLSAMLTSDREINPNDSRYHFRDILRETFASYGIEPASEGTEADPGIWSPPEEGLNYDLVHFESMQRDRDEVFRFIWQNRKALELYEDSYTRVLSLRPCLRIGPDGFALRETVVEYMQIVTVLAGELGRLKITAPEDMPADQELMLYGGGTLIFDEYGRVKYHITNRVNHAERQTQRLKYLWEYGYYRDPSSFRNFANLHRKKRAAPFANSIRQEW